ncbi:MAG: SurA N-terminal domain-containing protein [Porticoccaceae bacterium]|jgi:hypothetical protein|nr:MAG: hypothetical protein ABS22_08605 [SAR92 bacterium BACL16 MAG-120322-bin99]MDP4654132.1 SurA N-terminal domain-containing protein [Alphaproteobacteria bacterium]MDP4752595.1 SurA N-terminal domain-containing protein [Porticoccaceae bacterium]MDP4889907.1 SurA N-terminal domain-containing protein [Porticoccaceae bacterium]
MNNQPAKRRSLLVLALASAIGIGAGALSSLDWLATDTLPSTVAARINNTDIRTIDYQRALDLFASEKRDPLTPEDRQLVLQRLIEEELLVQYAIDAGMLRSNANVRQVVLQSMLAGFVAQINATAAENSALSSNHGSSHGSSHDSALASYLLDLRNTANIERFDLEGQQP